MIKVLYFAALREQLGAGSEEMELPAGIDNLGALAAHLGTRGDAWSDAFGGGRTVMMALNQEAARPEDVLTDGDEIAFYPPVTGG